MIKEIKWNRTIAPIKIVLADTYRDKRLCGNLMKRHLPPERRGEVDEVLKRAVILKMVLAWNFKETIKRRNPNFGFLVFEFSFEKPIVHFVYVSLNYRGRGIAKSLLEYALIEPPFFYTFQTNKKIRGATYKPQLLTKPWLNV